MRQQQIHTRTTLMLFATAIIWGFGFVAQVLGSDHIGPFTFTGFRFILGALSLLPVCLVLEKERDLSPQWRYRRRKHTALVSLLAGLALFIASTLQQYGTSLTRDPGKAGFITGLYTVFTPVLYFLIFRKKIGLNTWLGCLLATLGLYLICLREGDGAPFGIGEICLILGSVMWAVHILIVDRFIDSVSPLRFSAWQFLVSGILGLCAAFILEDVQLAGIQNASWALLFSGIPAVGVAYTLQIFGQRDADPTHAAIIFSTESVFAAIGGLLWNLVTPAHMHVTQDIRPLTIIGALLLFAAVVLSQIPWPIRRKAHFD